MPFVNLQKKFRFISFDFRQNFDVWTFPRWLSIRKSKFFFRDIQKIFPKGPIRYVPRRFFQIWIFYRQICILIRDFWVIFENYSMRMLSIGETILSHAEHTRNRFHRMLSIWGTNFRACSASDTIHAEHTQNEFYCTLSKRGTNFIACWAYWEPISLHAEHAWKCLKVELYLGRIEYDFQKSGDTGPWDHKDSVSAKK